MESRIAKIKELCKRTGINAFTAKEYLALADYEMELAIQIAEYFNANVIDNYPIGRVIRNYWEAKTKEWCW